MNRLTAISRRFLTLVARLAAFAAAGCGNDAAPELKLPPPVVTVSYPLQRDVQDYAEFTGRTAAVESVKVRARVFGHLEKINFTEGSEVKAGDVLFVIDKRPYKATFSRAKAELAQHQARFTRMKSEWIRIKNLHAKDAISQEEYDRVEGDYLESEAAANSASAAFETAKLNLDYTEIRAPVDGRISRKFVTIGNLVESGEMGQGTLLTTIVSIKPMYAYFDVDEPTYPRIEALVVKNAGKKGPPVEMAIGDERNFPHKGTIDFVDNQLEAGTGTMRVRGLFNNDDKFLVAGLFARLRVPLGDPHPAILVTERAIDTDQGLKVLYVVNNDKVVEKRGVRLGRLHDSLREIEEGIKLGDRIVVDGLHRIRPGATVDPKLVEMPVYQDARREANKAKTP